MKSKFFSPLGGSFCLWLIASIPVSAATKTWIGGAGTDNWTGPGQSASNNWDTGNIASGDDLIFGGGVRTAPNNIIANFAVGSIAFATGASPFTLGGDAVTLGGSVTNNSSTLQTIDLALGLSGNRTFAAISGDLAIGGVISGSFGIEKTGDNDLFLTVANTYTGTTTVTGGTLFANNATGSATGTGALSIGANAVLRGTGTITPTGSNGINVSGVLFPGGTLDTGNLTMNLGSTSGGITVSSDAGFAYRLGAAGGVIETVGISDLLIVAGASSNDFVFNNNTINFQSTGSAGFYKLFDTSFDATTWSGLTVDGDGLITAGLDFTNLASGLSGSLIMGGGSTFGGDAGDIYLQVIPEPTAGLLGGLGVLLLLRRRRA